MNKRISRNLAIFCVLILFYTLVFDHIYNKWLNSSLEPKLGWLGLGYGLLMFVTGLMLGALDKARNVRVDLGFAYHFATFMVVNLVSIASALVRGHPLFEWVSTPNEHSFTAPMILFWLPGLVIHYWASRKTIKGIEKDKLFR